MNRAKDPAAPPEIGARENAPTRDLGGTWPLFDEPRPAFPFDPKFAITPFRPEHADLESLEGRQDLPETTPQAEAEARKFRETDPPAAPEWVRAARAMVAWLEQRIARGELDALEEATISRAWAAFSLAGSSEPQLLRVAHLVSRAHHAIRESPRGSHELQAALLDCAGVLHQGLPRSVRERMPFERTLELVRTLRLEVDAWAAVVEGTCELLGWKDYARAHAALVIRSAIERSR